MFKPKYIDLYQSGELEKRVLILEEHLRSCDICPRECGVDRLLDEKGYCQSGYLPIVSSFCDHHGEEPVLSGQKGSGTIFFGNCNLSCVYCQNYQISQNTDNQKCSEIEITQLVKTMILLQDKFGCHNINFVSPSHFVPQIVRAVLDAVPMGLHIPLVYNSSGYDSINTIKLLDGIIDIYLPDIRYSSDLFAEKYSKAPSYVFNSRQAIKEMFRQVGILKIDEQGNAIRGMIVRHLILPNGLSGSGESLEWLATEISSLVTVSIMAQYMPLHKARLYPELSRKITKAEYDTVLTILASLGLENGWQQELDSPECYLPDFNSELNPFKLPKTK